jgi:hypothetical protein
MSLARVIKFGTAWNIRDPNLIASFFTHAPVGPTISADHFSAAKKFTAAPKIFFDRFADRRFEP